MNALSVDNLMRCPEPLAATTAAGRGSHVAARPGRLSGRPSCRIYALNRWWILQTERRSAWLEGLPAPGGFRMFRTLGAAINFAEAYGLDYRVIRRKPFFVRHPRSRDGSRKGRAIGPAVNG